VEHSSAGVLCVTAVHRPVLVLSDAALTVLSDGGLCHAVSLPLAGVRAHLYYITHPLLGCETMIVLIIYRLL